MHRTDGDLRFGLFITAAGEAAIGVERAPPATRTKSQPQAAVALAAPEATQAGPRTTKAALVLDLLRREDGVTLAELIAATGWLPHTTRALPHTTRAALTGLRKKGYDVRRGKRGDATCYSVASDAADAR